jgi:FkbM family methyltransferase
VETDVIKRLDARVNHFGRTKFQKICASPINFLYAAILESAALRRREGIKTKARLFNGDSMAVVFPELVSVALRRYGFYEEGLTKMLLENLKPGMTFIDVGAQYGYYTILCSWIVGKGGQVHSFEPTPSTFQVLSSNAENRPNIHLNNIALGDQPGTVSLYEYGPRFAGLNSLSRWEKFHQEAAALGDVNISEVTSTSLDIYVRENKLDVGFVKIDAKGSEARILTGMDETIDRSRPVIALEVGDKEIEGVMSSRDLVMKLCDKGYRAYEFTGGRVSEHQLKDGYQTDNLLFLPQD